MPFTFDEAPQGVLDFIPTYRGNDELEEPMTIHYHVCSYADLQRARAKTQGKEFRKGKKANHIKSTNVLRDYILSKYIDGVSNCRRKNGTGESIPVTSTREFLDLARKAGGAAEQLFDEIFDAIVGDSGLEDDEKNE